MVSLAVLPSASGDWNYGRILVALTTFLTSHFYSHKIADGGFLNYEYSFENQNHISQFNKMMALSFVTFSWHASEHIISRKILKSYYYIAMLVAVSGNE